MGYPPTGPFNNGAAPGIAAPFLNTLEDYLGGVPQFSLFGPYNVTTSPDYYAHNLGDVPDIVIVQINGATSTTRTCVYDHNTLDATNVRLTGNGSFSVRGIAIKF